MHHRSDLLEDTSKHWVKTPQRLPQPLQHCSWMGMITVGAVTQCFCFSSKAGLKNCQPCLPSATHYRPMPHFFRRLFLAWIISVSLHKYCYADRWICDLWQSATNQWLASFLELQFCCTGRGERRNSQISQKTWHILTSWWLCSWDLKPNSRVQSSSLLWWK